MKHQLYECPPGCDTPHCNYCEGGLAFCTVCKCGESSLPTDCPGKPVNEIVELAIQNGNLNYLDGQGWVGK